jgi:UDP-N-acetyl-D-glucosamine 4,6-dehydratase
MFKKIIQPTKFKRAIFFVIIDTFLFFLSLLLAFQLRFNFHIPNAFIESFWSIVAILIFLKIALFFIFKIYFKTWKFFAFDDVKEVLIALFIADILFVLYLKIFFTSVFPRSTIIIDFLISFFFVVSVRLSKRLITQSGKNDSPHNAVIIGANQRAINILSSSSKGEIDFNPVAIVDDDSSVLGTYLSNVKVYGMEKLDRLIQDKDIDSAIVTKEYSTAELDELFEKLNDLGVKNIKISKLLGEKHEKFRDISIEDLLAREPKDLDLEAIKNLIKDRVVLITGAGGSIGSEIARQCERFAAKKLILLDHSEYNLYKISEEIKKVPTSTLMLSVVDRKLLKKSFDRERPQIVIHAAAYKHVPLCERNVEGAVLNNVIGTKNVIDISIETGVERFVLISTDKAVRPTNVMGATKRVCELYAQNVDSKDMKIGIVRFGNVLGSSGSVIPKFKYQIEHNQPLTVTHPNITRYFMLIPEACQLVLQAASLAEDRELFILDMGEPVKIVDLAKKMLKLYNREDLGVEFTSLREGEKLYEELLLDESDKKTIYDSIFVAAPTKYDIIKLNMDIERLLDCKDKVAVLKEIVPEFKHKSIER